MGTDVKWVARLRHVREVTLRGSADLAFWRDRLAGESLAPAADHDGRAQVIIVAADAAFHGVRFREISVSVLAYRHGPAGRLDGAYLVQAWNSRRAFAFCERVFFAAPYAHAAVRVRAAVPAAVEVRDDDAGVLLRAEMRAADGRGAASSAPGGWDGAVFLPRRGGGGGGRPGKIFFAQITGPTDVRPFVPGEDVVTIGARPGHPALAALGASHFAAERWEIRAHAVHAKSRTYGAAAPAVVARAVDASELRTQ